MHQSWETKKERLRFFHSGLALRSCFIARSHGIISCRAGYGNSTVSRQFSIEAPPAVLAFEEDVGYVVFLSISISSDSLLSHLLYDTSSPSHSIHSNHQSILFHPFFLPHHYRILNPFLSRSIRMGISYSSSAAQSTPNSSIRICDFHCPFPSLKDQRSRVSPNTSVIRRDKSGEK